MGRPSNSSTQRLFPYYLLPAAHIPVPVQSHPKGLIQLQGDRIKNAQFHSSVLLYGVRAPVKFVWHKKEQDLHDHKWHDAQDNLFFSSAYHAGAPPIFHILFFFDFAAALMRGYVEPSNYTFGALALAVGGLLGAFQLEHYILKVY